jgi:hypothetical protein
MAIWRWAKLNGIDHGLPFEKIHDAINEHFFAGAAKPEWITDILSGRKTPFRELANEAWRTQYNRRMIVDHAKSLTEQQAMSPAGRAFQKYWEKYSPRGLAVKAHGWVFPVTHAGDLILRPASWGTFFRGLINTYSKSFSKAGTERLLDSMRRSPRYDLALRSGLDVGARSHAGNLVNRAAKGSQSTRAWDILTTMRFQLWDRAMDKHIDPKMSQAEQLDIGKNLAEWANHATGSGKGVVASMGSKVLFGPKLTQSKLNRMFADPVKTVQTFANWNNATAGEKIVARTRLSGMTQYALTGLGFLVANQGLLQALGSKQQINLTDPSKPDWLKFKGLGVDVGLPGLHSELSTIAKILAIPFISLKDVEKRSYGTAKSKQEYFGQLLSDYLLSKATPTIGLGKELLTGEVFPHRPVPWSKEPGKPAQPRMSWPEYLASHGPILASNPARYFFDQLRKGGMSAFDAAALMKGLVISAVGATGLHVAAEKEPPTPEEIKARKAATNAARAATRKANILAKRRQAWEESHRNR